ncbi:MAG: PEP/pyruvate-binding domain-containing protein [Nanoarchaeota archaeon]
MEYTKTLRNINRADVLLVGMRAITLSILHENRLPMPLSFVITSHCLEKFLEDNELKEKAEQVLVRQENPEAADQEIAGLFLAAVFSDEIAEELGEAYESLNMGDESGSASMLVKKAEEPNLMLIPSLDYPQDPEESTKIIRAMAGKKQFLDSLKTCFGLLFTSAAHDFRENAGVTAFKAGVIVQRMIDEEISGEAYVQDDNEILIKAYAGIYNPENKSEKDIFIVSRNYINITSAKVVHQDFKLVRDEREIISYPLKERGSRQKANDKEVIELARIGKRAAMILEQKVSCVMGLKREKAYLFFCDELPSPEKIKEAAEAKESIKEQPSYPAEADLGRRHVILSGPEEEQDEHAEISQEPEEMIHASAAEVPQGLAQAFEISLEDTKQASESGKEDNFIITIPEEETRQEEPHGQAAQFEEKIDKQMILDNSMQEFNKLILNASMIITNALQEKYLTIQGDEPGSFLNMIKALEKTRSIPCKKEILLIEKLKDKFLKEPGALTLQEIQFSMETAKKFLQEFR